jgi:FHS family L-fucose permease-like MFS transporter
LGRLVGASIGAKYQESIKIFVSALGWSDCCAIFSQKQLLSLFLILVQQYLLAYLFLVLQGFVPLIMWGGIFNLAVEGLGKYIAVHLGFLW